MKQLSLKKFVSAILSGLLVLLGFSSCDSEGGRIMYGTPTADFTIKGQVIHAEDKQKVLPDIQIVIYQLPEESGVHYADTLFTDKNGRFEFISLSTYAAEKYRVIYEEKEDQRGEIPLKKGQVDVTPERVKKGSGAWYYGKFEAEVLIEMENDTPVEPE